MALFTLTTSVFLMTFTTEAKAKNEDTWLSPEIQGYCEEIGEEYSICPELLEALIETESSGNPQATCGNCRGLMQVNPDIHKDRMKRFFVSYSTVYKSSRALRVEGRK